MVRLLLLESKLDSLPKHVDCLKTLTPTAFNFGLDATAHLRIITDYEKVDVNNIIFSYPSSTKQKLSNIYTLVGLFCFNYD